MVFVLDKRKKPLMPCTEKRARLLLERGRAVVHKMYPFTIRLKDRVVEDSKVQPLRLKLDPGSKTTGMAVLRNDTAIWLAELKHKLGIKDKLDSRRALRRSRRNRKTRYRKPRFLNRKRKKGWLPPSLEARVNQTLNAVLKLQRLLPLEAISTEHVKFDTQLIQNPNIQGIEYQQGELYGYEVREYLLEKFKRKCVYCGAENTPLQIEHYIPKAKGGTDRISNLAIACKDCNQDKGKLLPKEWVALLRQSKKKSDHQRADKVLEVAKQLRQPLKDAAMMNATRWRLYERLVATGLPVECGTGARTKMQRIQQGLPKKHYYDACCVGSSTPETLVVKPTHVAVWNAKGKGSRQMCHTNKYGFPRGHRTRQKLFFGFQTGDIVRADVPKGKYQGKHVGRVTVRKSGYFDIKDGTGKCLCQGVSHKHMQVLQRNDGWQYEKKEVAA